MVNESLVCVNIIAKYSSPSSSLTVPSHLLPIISKHQTNDPTTTNKQIMSEETILTDRIGESLEALKVFDQLDSAMEMVLSKSGGIIQKAVNDSIALLRLLMKDGTVADSSHLVQLVQVVGSFILKDLKLKFLISFFSLSFK